MGCSKTVVERWVLQHRYKETKVEVGAKEVL